MALSVTSNFSISAGYASNNMRNSQTLMGKSINRISSGLRAPKPADNAVSYVSGTKLKVDSEGYNVLSTGVQDMAARLNMADSVLSDISNALLELKANAIAYGSTTDGQAQTTIANVSKELVENVEGMFDNAKYKGSALFDDSADLNVYYGVDGTGAVKIEKETFSKPTGLDNVDQVTSGFTGATALQTVIDNVTSQRATIGGQISALETISNYLSDLTSSADAAYTAVTEVDMAREMTAYVKNNVQSQAAQAMVAQANQGLAQVLNLLQV